MARGYVTTHKTKNKPPAGFSSVYFWSREYVANENYVLIVDKGGFVMKRERKKGANMSPYLHLLSREDPRSCTITVVSNSFY